MTGVSIRGLELHYGPLKVLQTLDLEIAQGEFVVLLGPSGCGKSTLLNAIAGLLDVSAGQIWIGGRNVTWEEPKDRGIGMVFQSYALYPRMDVLGNLSFGLKMARVPRVEIQRRVERAARILQIEPLLKRRPAELSGGQRQRVAIGRALVREAGVFLFDEPLSNLDAKLRTELRVELKRLHAELGATMIYVTHDQIEALTLADRIAVMHGGVVQQVDTPKVIYQKPVNRFVAGFVGAPSMNFLSGTLATRDGRPVFVGAGGEATALDGYGFGRPLEEGEPVALGLRPEHIALAPTDRQHAAVTATLGLVEPMGADALVWGQSGPDPVSVRIAGDAELPALGDTLRPLFFQPELASLFDGQGRRI
jgi:multiple sugar transport system ATP-binding protein